VGDQNASTQDLRCDGALSQLLVGSRYTGGLIDGGGVEIRARSALEVTAVIELVWVGEIET
jgi:hypothetical protein